MLVVIKMGNFKLWTSGCVLSSNSLGWTEQRAFLYCLRRDRLQQRSSAPCWMTIGKIILILLFPSSNMAARDFVVWISWEWLQTPIGLLYFLSLTRAQSLPGTTSPMSSPGPARIWWPVTERETLWTQSNTRTMKCWLQFHCPSSITVSKHT